jgi:hypothetical protein
MSDQNNRFLAKRIYFDQIDQPFIDQWRALEAESLQNNAFLSPCFIIPAIKYLTKDSSVQFVAVYSSDTNELCGLGVFTYRAGSIDFPLPHWEAYKSTHSYLTGLMLSKSGPSEIAMTMFSFLKHNPPRVYGIKFSSLDFSGGLGDIFNQLDRSSGFSWFETGSKQRAMLYIAELGDKWDSHISARRRKNYRRGLKKLSELHPVNWRVVQNGDVGRSNIDDLLRLEHKGWKKSDNFSLLSQKGHKEFFTEAAEAYARNNQAFFTELLLGNTVIASTCNFVSGKNGFGFKIGWDPDYQEFSPGIINEMELMRNAKSHLSSIEAIDSGATETSFINSYWSKRKTLTNGVIVFGAFASLVLRIMHVLRRFKGAILSVKNHLQPSAEHPRE